MLLGEKSSMPIVQVTLKLKINNNQNCIMLASRIKLWKNLSTIAHILGKGVNICSLIFFIFIRIAIFFY